MHFMISLQLVLLQYLIDIFPMRHIYISTAYQLDIIMPHASQEVFFIEVHIFIFPVKLDFIKVVCITSRGSQSA